MLPMSMSVPSGRTRTPTKFSYLPLFTFFPTGAARVAEGTLEEASQRGSTVVAYDAGHQRRLA
jgi:hypothetical protein